MRLKVATYECGLLDDAHVEEGGSIKMIMGAALAAAAAGIAYKMTL